MAYHSIPVPPTDFKGTLTEWNAFTPVSQYCRVNRAKRAAYNRRWYQQHKKRAIEDAKQWKQQNPVKVAGHQKKAYIKRERAFYAMFGSQGII